MSDSLPTTPRLVLPDASETLPLPVRHALETGNCVLFVGAGIGTCARNKKGEPAPTAVELSVELAKKFGIDAGDDRDLAKVAELVAINNKGRGELLTVLKEKLADLEPDDNLKWLFSIRWKAIFTTNYDRLIERTYELNPDPVQQPKPISLSRELVPYDPRFDVPIFHLHGRLFDEAEPRVIVTQTDYIRFRDGRKMLFEFLKSEFATSTILYVGYSNLDPNWRTVLDETQSEFFPARLPPAFRVAPKTNVLDREILKAMGIETIDASLEEFVQVAAANTQPVFTNEDYWKRAAAAVPHALTAAYKQSPAALLRLLSSWEYVNEANLAEAPNTREFLRGDRPNWAVIAQGKYFERDLTEDLYGDSLDYITSDSTKARAVGVLASAGYGTSTALRILAIRLVKERAGPVFFHKSGRPLLQGDVEFATSLFPEAVTLFFIDDAADQSSSLFSAVTRVRHLRRPALFVVGERKNEWRQQRGKLNIKEYELTALSESEIPRVITYLEQNGELGALFDLSNEMRIATIKSKHANDLLVTLRESIEDKRFDAILEDEYRGIGNDIARNLYLLVCGFYQHGALARDELLATLLKTGLVTLHENTRDETEGVVIYECIDEARGLYAARARHRVIATVVWDRCGAPGEKETILHHALAALNLNYPSDASAFEHFIRSDRIVDSLRTLDSRIKFFERACQKDPVTPYVRQHYARMLLRSDKHDLALSQIDEAIRLDSRVRVLYHTKGKILSRLAIAIDSIDLARRRLVQGEEAFRQSLSMHADDEYSYQGLAELYLEWAKRVPDVEAAEYIAKAEEVIGEGLKKVSAEKACGLCRRASRNGSETCRPGLTPSRRPCRALQAGSFQGISSEALTGGIVSPRKLSRFSNQ